jgi:hypothetical protein
MDMRSVVTRYVPVSNKCIIGLRVIFAGLPGQLYATLRNGFGIITLVTQSDEFCLWVGATV